jgi:outer membrane lipoprotein-sorting protein
LNIFRRLSLPKLIVLCAVVVGVGASVTALAFALGTGPVPPGRPLAQAVHDALAAPSVEGVSANVKLTNHLLEGANLASEDGQGGGLSSSPLVNGASGRLWIAKDGRVRLELQAEKGDTQILYDGHTLSLYDASTNTLYRYTPEASSGSTPGAPDHGSSADGGHEAPSVAKIEEAIGHAREHVQLTGATPSDVAGRAAYTVRVSPKEGGSLLGGAELSFDAANGVPLRAAVYSSTSASPVIELAATEISYGPVESSVFSFTPPANAKVEDIAAPAQTGAAAAAAKRARAARRVHRHAHAAGRLQTHGHGITAVAVLKGTAKPGGGQGQSQGSLEGLPKVDINGTSATELRTALGTLLSFERAGVRYVLVGAVPPAAVEAVARGL